MKLIAFVAAGLLAAAAVQPTPVEAQPRHGWHNDRHGSHWNRGHRSRWRNVCRTQ